MYTLNKIWKISSKKIKKISFFYFFFSIANSLIEVLSIVALLPFLQFILEKTSLDLDRGPLSYLKFLKDLELNTDFGTTLFVFVIFVYFLKLVFNCINLYLNQKIIFEYRKHLPKSLLNMYMAHNYTFFLKNNSSHLLKNIVAETSNVIMGCVAMIMGLVSDVMLASLAIISLLFFDFNTTIFIGFFLFLIIFLYLFFSRKIVHSTSQNRTYFDTYNFQAISNIFDNIKLIKILSNENYFIKYFENANNDWAKSHLKFNIVAQLPRILLEFILVIAIIFTTIVFLADKNPDIVYLMALYVLVAIRLIPLLSKIVSAMQNLKFNLPALNILYKEFCSIDEYTNNSDVGKNHNIKLKNFIKFENVSFTHSANSETILENISLKIEKNDFIGVIGETGSGKSTFVDLLSGLIQPTSGKIIVDNNFIISEKNQKIWQKNIGYLSQNITVLDGTIRDNIAFGCNEADIDNRKIEKVIESAALSDFVAKRHGGIFSEIGQGGKLMSGGEKQRIAIARTLYFEPEFLILDECTSSLDVDTEFEILNILMKLESKTIVFITHRKHNLKNCNKIYEVKEKKILPKIINEIF